MFSRAPLAVTFDAAGTLLHPARPVAMVYAEAARAHGITAVDGRELTLERIDTRFRSAFANVPVRQDGDGRAFWRHVVQMTLGSRDPALFAQLYAHYARPHAWTWAPGALASLAALRGRGLRVGLISNWDTRLRALLCEAGALRHFDHVYISGEQAHDKPHPACFTTTAEALRVPIGRMLHVGDSRGADVEGARAAGALAWHWTGAEARMDALLAAVVGAAEGDGGGSGGGRLALAG